MRVTIRFTDDSYVNIPTDTLDVDTVNGFLYAYTDKLVGAFKLEFVKDAHLSEKGGVDNA